MDAAGLPLKLSGPFLMTFAQRMHSTLSNPSIPKTRFGTTIPSGRPSREEKRPRTAACVLARMGENGGHWIKSVLFLCLVDRQLSLALW